MSDYNDLLPEERDEQNQQLMTSLRHSFDTLSEDEQSLNRIRKRLLQTNVDSLPHQLTVVPLPTQSQKKGKTDMQFISSKFYEGKTWQQRLGTFVAVILVLVLVSSLATVFYIRSHDSEVGNQPMLSPGWQQILSLSGTGSKTLTSLNIQLTQLWGDSVSGCVGKGQVTFELIEISYKIVSGCNGDTSASSQNNPALSIMEPQAFQFSQPSKLTIHTLKVTTTSSLTWYLRLANSNVSMMPFLRTLTASKYGWASYSGFGGNGDGAFSNVTGESVKTLGLLMRCDKKETLQITFNNASSSAKTFACDTHTNLYIVHFPQTVTLQDIHVHVSSIDSWYLQTVRCTKESACSSL